MKTSELAKILIESNERKIEIAKDIERGLELFAWGFLLLAVIYFGGHIVAASVKLI